VRLEAVGRFVIHGEAKEFSFQNYIKMDDVSWDTLDTGGAAYYGRDED
jgi:hypothetical protein